MDRPLCPLMDEFGKPCNRPMYANIPDLHYSDGVQITIWQCFSMDSKHTIPIEEPIPAWEEFRKERPPPPQARRMTPRQKRRILRMLAKEMPLVKISQKTGFSSVAIYRLKAISKGVK